MLSSLWEPWTQVNSRSWNMQGELSAPVDGSTDIICSQIKPGSAIGISSSSQWPQRTPGPLSLLGLVPKWVGTCILLFFPSDRYPAWAVWGLSQTQPCLHVCCVRAELPSEETQMSLVWLPALGQGTLSGCFLGVFLGLFQM